MTENYIRSAGDSAKICVVSSRHLSRQVYFCSIYEAEDILVDTGNVDLICPEPAVGYEWRSRWLSRLAYRDISGKTALANPGVRSVRLDRDYELFVAVCETYEDLLHVNAVKGWKDRCKTSVCWLHEIWANSLYKYRNWLEALRKFDYVFVDLQGSVEPLSKALGRPCYWLPAAADLMRFGPQLKPISRVIDVMSVGRRQEGMHRALAGMASRNELFYMFDTFAAANAKVYDYRAHRDHFARLAKRSRYFIVAPAKMDATHETGGQIEIGVRYYEGAAAGTVMLGQSPDTAHFRSLFGWQDSVIEVAPDGSDICDTIRNLDAEPERFREISRRNTVESLLRHDWMHRWNDIFRIVGMKPYDNMVARTDYLKDLASVLVSREGANRIEGRYTKEYA